VFAKLAEVTLRFPWGRARAAAGTPSNPLADSEWWPVPRYLGPYETFRLQGAPLSGEQFERAPHLRSEAAAESYRRDGDFARCPLTQRL
jgi:hypothetical protein